MSVRDLIPILQVAIGPVILISGVGLLLLCMTNRFARIVDRSRQLSNALHAAPEAARALIASQLEILSTRARLVRLSILLAAFAVLLAATLIIVLFLTALVGLEAPWLLAAIFIACMACVIGAMVVFIRDINLSLAALKLELDSAMTTTHA
ncbi:MAG: DUF2721 domain-containing protein [bacterium]